MDKIFFINFKKAAIGPAISTSAFAGIGYFVQSMFHTTSGPINMFSIFMYAAAIYFGGISVFFLMKSNKEYIVLGKSKIKIFSEKEDICIPYSLILSVDLIESPIKHTAWTKWGMVKVNEFGKVIRIKLTDVAASELQFQKSDINGRFFPSQLVHIGDDNKEIILKGDPIGGFNSLFKEIKSYQV